MYELAHLALEVILPGLYRRMPRGSMKSESYRHPNLVFLQDLLVESLERLRF